MAVYIQIDNYSKKKQRGQSIALLAISIVTLLGMAALAVDLTTLYVARSEMQRAADAAALAGAKAFVISGVTTAPSNPTLQTLATTMCSGFVNSILARNKVGGVVPTLAAGYPTTDFSRLGNPQVTVKVQRTDVPTFFSRVFRMFGSGAASVTVSATATAEAYNSSNPGGAGAGSMPPVAPSYVKPWLVVNLDPDHPVGASYDPFVNPDGSVAHPGVWVGTVLAPPPGTCSPAGAGGVISECITLIDLWPKAGTVTAPGWLPAAIPTTPSGLCPSCAAGVNFQLSASCSDTANASLYRCGATTATIDTDDDGVETMNGASCLMNGSATGGPDVGQDNIFYNDFQATGGADPIRILSETDPHWGDNVTTSKQIVTLPIISTNLAPVTVVGYMQAFLEATTTPNEGLVLTVLNISGCGSSINTAATPVSGETSSPVPVRLIH